jgi:hypothetical protein
MLQKPHEIYETERYHSQNDEQYQRGGHARNNNINN